MKCPRLRFHTMAYALYPVPVSFYRHTHSTRYRYCTGKLASFQFQGTAQTRRVRVLHAEMTPEPGGQFELECQFSSRSAAATR